KSNQKKGDPDEAPSLREGSRRASGVFRRHIPVPAENSRASCARPCGPVLRPAAASYGIQEQDQEQSRRKRVVVGWAEKPSALREGFGSRDWCWAPAANASYRCAQGAPNTGYAARREFDPARNPGCCSCCCSAL